MVADLGPGLGRHGSVVPGDSHTAEELDLPIARDHAYAATTGGRVGEVDVFAERGIDPECGALVLVRPDQYVAHVLPLDAHEALAGFFAGILIDAT